jgi:phosphatidylinositol alpha 1,6-mannosyltransferase
VDQELFHPGRRDEALHRKLAPSGGLLVGYVGRLAPEKELELLAHVDRLPGIRLVLVGGGPEEARLTALLPGAAFLGVLHGDELARAYATLDVFVHTGRHETYCQSAQEALASGVPVVAPRSGGPIDVVDDTVAGYLYEPGDAEELARHVERLVTHPVLRRRTAVAARQSVRGRTWQAVNELLIDHYREVSAPVARRRRAG